MDEKAINGAALVTVQAGDLRAIPARTERCAWLWWLRAQGSRPGVACSETFAPARRKARLREMHAPYWRS
jgi:hypothetical protein